MLKKLKRKEYVEKNREKIKAYYREYREKNREKYRKYHREYMARTRKEEILRKAEDMRLQEKFDKLDLIYIEKMNKLINN